MGEGNERKRERGREKGQGAGKRVVKARSLATLGASMGRRPEDGEVIAVERTLGASSGLEWGFAD